MRKLFFIGTLVGLLSASFVFIFISFIDSRSTGQLTVDPGHSSLYIKNSDLTVLGQDKDGVTYFFLPSYAEMNYLIQDESGAKIYLADGSLLSDPMFGEVQPVNIDLGNGEVTPWFISFMRSDNLYTLDIDLRGANVSDISHDIYMPSGISLYSRYGKLECRDESVLIKGRGNTTWNAAKQPYEIKLSERFPMCGLESSSKWVLLANFFDDTKILNKMAMDLSADMDMGYAIESDWIDLYINGEYRGNYLICKEPGIGNGRLRTNEGFLVEKDIRADPNEKDAIFKVDSNVFRIKDPLPLTSEASDEIASYVSEISDSIHTMSGGDLPASIDRYSFIRRFMIDELFNNPDTMQTSYYFYRQSDTLYAGPCWDYDLSCGKSLNGMDFYDYSRSILDDMSEDCLDWDPVLLANETYRHEYAAAFAEYMPLFNDLLETRIDSYAKKISASLEMDRALWQNDEIPVRFYSDAGNKYRFIKFYLYKRMQLLASYCGYNAALPDISLNKSETHSVTFVTENGSSSLDVSDGTLLSEKDLPDYDHTRFSGWKYQREDKPFSHFLPVYEDISLELMPIPPT